MNRERFPGLRDGWARLDGPAGTQMVDAAIDAMTEWMRSGHGANNHGAFAAAARTGATVRLVEPDPETLALDAAAVEAVLGERTRWVAVTAASNAVGTVPGLRGIVDAADAAGARVYVDAVHAAPHFRHDLEALGCDVLARSAYKWFGPHVGILRAANVDRASRGGSRAGTVRDTPSRGPGGWSRNVAPGRHFVTDPPAGDEVGDEMSRAGAERPPDAPVDPEIV